MTVVVDTNVIVVANDRDADQATPECVLRSVERLRAIQGTGTLALDSGLKILNEYFRHANRSGQPGVGDAFARWAFDNQGYIDRCRFVDITPTDDGSYLEFPSDPRLSNFDRNDRKFVAVSVTHPERPPILNAADSDWSNVALAENGIRVEHVCLTTDLPSHR